MTIPFHDLRPTHALLGDALREAALRVLDSGWYVLGPEVEAFEDRLAHYLDAQCAVGVANGTDAIELALRGAGIGAGDEVITVSHTAVATLCGIERAGARPVLVDIDPATYTMCPRAAEAAITSRTKALLPVHLYGHAADLGRLSDLAARHHLLLIEDCAQALGATYDGRPVGTWGHASAVSFYPTKNLGACGDAGAVVTNDVALAQRVRQLRSYGQATRDQSVERGINSRLDELQAALLSAKLPYLDEFNAQRRELAACYESALQGVIKPIERAPARHVYHLYVVRHAQRDALRQQLTERGIGTLVHYPQPVHRQPAYASLGYGAGSLPQTERAAKEILSLPLYPGLTADDVRRVADAVAESLAGVQV